MAEIDYEKERESDVEAILASDSPRKVVVAGPGTGKSFLFKRIIEQKKAAGKKDFLAVTFLGRLGDLLADDLAGMAETTTMHGFAREFVLSNLRSPWRYSPKVARIIREDLALIGVDDPAIGDENYRKRTYYYKAIGEDDVVHYAVQLCKRNSAVILTRDLILIDEFQDFNETEDEFINILSEKSEVLIVGDDDQALYTFRGTHPRYLRLKNDAATTDWKSHTLRFCSRCPEVIVSVFHDMVDTYKELIESRIDKDYFYFSPDKELDSELNPSIVEMRLMPGQIPSRVRSALAGMLEEQKIKSVLIIGEAQTCRSVLASTARGLREMGFQNVTFSSDDHKPFSTKSHVVEAYRILNQGAHPILGWRLLAEELDKSIRENLVRENYADASAFIDAIPADFKEEHLANAKTLARIIDSPRSARKKIPEAHVNRLMAQVVSSKRSEREMLFDQLISENKFLPRPLGNLDITVTTILGSKGLGADVVFLVGFDNGKLPADVSIREDEVYQMLVALTRTKKRLYLVSTAGGEVSSFRGAINNRYLSTTG